MTEALHITRALGLLGMGAVEARAFEHLGATGPQDAAGVALGIHVTRGQAYRALAALVRGGRVVTGGTRPSLYQAVDPADLSELAYAEEAARGRALEAAKVAFRATVASAHAPRAAAHAPWKARRVHGREAFHAAARRLLLKAHTSVLIAYAPGSSAVDAKARASLLAVAERKNAEGVRSRIVTSAPLAHGAQGAPAPAFVVIDGKECLFLAADGAPFGAMAQGCWTSAATIVALAGMLHDVMWQDVELRSTPGFLPQVRERPQCLAPPTARGA